MIHINKREYLLELKNLLDSMRKDDRDAVLQMAASCFEAGESDEEVIERIGRPMAAARRVLRSYEPGCYAELLVEDEEEEFCVSEQTGEEAEEEDLELVEEVSAAAEKSIVDKIYAEVFGLEPKKTDEELSVEPEENLEEPQEPAEEEFYEGTGEEPAAERNEAAIEIARAVEERAAHEQRAEKEKKSTKPDEKPKYSVVKLVGYSIPAIALGIPVSILLVALSLVILLIGAAIAASGALIISFIFLNMAAISDILMTAGAGLAVFAFGAEIVVLAVYFFGKHSIGFINRVLEGGAKNCLKDTSKYRAPIVEEESLGQKLVRTLSTILLSLMGIGILSFLFSMVLGADIKRIAAAIFGKYDLAAVLRYLIDTFEGLKAFIFR